MTFIAAPRHDRIDAPWVLNGPINGEAFKTYVQAELIRTHQPGDIVVRDNLGNHKGKEVRTMVGAAGARMRNSLNQAVVQFEAPPERAIHVTAAVDDFTHDHSARRFRKVLHDADAIVFQENITHQQIAFDKWTAH